MTPADARDEPGLRDWLGPGEASHLSQADLADLEVAVEAVLAGGREVMRRYRGRGAMEVDEKAPDDPVTEADREADRAIVRALDRLRPGEPVRSEEAGLSAPGFGPDAWGPDEGHLWVVDPLDGTKEFLARNGEFAVMVGLAVAGRARLGALYRPDPGVLFLGTTAGGAWRAELKDEETRRRERAERRGDGSDEGEGEDGGASAEAVDERLRRLGRRTGERGGPDRGVPDPIEERGGPDAEDGDGDEEDEGVPEVRGLADFREPVPLSLASSRHAPLRIVHSRSHRPEGLDTLAAALGETELLPSGSSGLKCALVAAGEADLYVHPVPYLKEWDTCAPEAVLRGAGGRITDCRGEPLLYGKDDPAQTGGLFAARPDVWEDASDAVRRLAP